MSLSVPPPLFHLSQFRDESRKSTKNKRKSHEPKKLSCETTFSEKRFKIDNNNYDGSDGEQIRSPSGSVGSNSSVDSQPLSPPSSSLAPKKRFKQEALKSLEEEEKTGGKSLNPFRPWDNGASVKKEEPNLELASLQTFLQYSQLLSPHMRINSRSVESVVGQTPALSEFLLQNRIPHPANLSADRSTPNSDSDCSHADVSVKIEATSPAEQPHNFELDTRQVLSRLYPFLMGQPTESVEPEQDEPLALVKRKTEDSSRVLSESQARFDSEGGSTSAGSKLKQRNYKNMTRERRIEANARERQRVHTITAAFDRLQHAIPTSDDGGAKLSKLSIIKIATSYIMVLSRMAGYDYSSDQTAPSVEECIKHCADLVKAETKSRKRFSESSD